MAVLQLAMVLVCILKFGSIEATRVEVAVAKFQTDEIATIDSMLDGGMEGLPTMEQVTMTLHLRLRHFTSHIPLLSYAVEGSSEEFLVEMVPKKKNMHVYCCNGLVSVAIRYEPKMFQWIHIAVGLNLTARTLYVNHDHNISKVNLKIDYSKIGSEKKLVVKGGGRLVIGQRLYSTTGGHHILESLDGEIGDYRIYDVFLTPREIKDILDCGNPFISRPPIINMNDETLKPVGHIIVRRLFLDTICSAFSTEFFLFFPDKMNNHDSESWCRKIKGELVLPQSPVLNERFFHEFLPYRERCQDIWTHLYWLGMRGDLKKKTWMRLSDNNPVDWYNFLSQYKTVTKEFQCAATVSHDPYKWAACPCEIEVCVLCNFTTHPELRLRGLCRISLLDRTYSFRENINYDLVFDGMTHNMIFFENGTWVMKSRLYPGLGGRMILKRRGEYPVGVHTWEIFGDRCPEKRANILLTSCEYDQYTCNDGTCIQKDRRCDLSIDCQDQSDEVNCTVVQLPFGYSNEIPPPNFDGKPLPVSISFVITSIKDFNLVSFQIGADILILTKWKDQRLKFKNLKASFRANQLESFQNVWTPNLKYRDGTMSAVKVIKHSHALYVDRLTKPLKDDDSTILEDKVYSGKGNLLLLEQEQTFTFKCHFNLQLYPFDRQICNIEFIMHDLTNEFGVLKKDGDGVRFVGERLLLEYRLLSEVFSNHTKDSVSHAKITMEFQNLYGYYIGNTFTPTIMLVIICYACLLFDLADFQDRIMVSLTSLLVLATFFSQTSQSIPKTSYLKLIDVWFVTLIAEDFAVIVSLVLIEVLRLRELSVGKVKTIRVAPVEKNKLLLKLRISDMTWFTDPRKLNTVLLWFYPISMILLLLVFAYVCVHSLLREINLQE